MSLEKIMSISGKPGIFNLILQTRTGFVVESLLDKKKTTMKLNSNVSLLSEIAIFTYNEEVKLFKVFKTIATKEECKATISHKESNEVIATYFREILPEYDEDRVYLSDIKKILNWYNILQTNGLVTLEAFDVVEKDDLTI
jgi:Domain of unknown function (DUF5606)